MLYELRHYDVANSRLMPVLMEEFEQRIIPAFERYEIEPAGFWQTIVGEPQPRLTYMLCWESLAAREQQWSAFEQEVVRFGTGVLSSLHTADSPIRRITNSILRPTDFSFLPRHDNQPPRYSGGVYEMREYTLANDADLNAIVAWMGSQGLPHLQKHGFFCMGFWTTIIGTQPRLSVMLIFETLAHRERAWAAFYTDPNWTALQDGLYPGGRALIQSLSTTLMRGTEFSGWR